MFEESPCVRIKGVGRDLWVTIVSGSPFEMIQTELTRVFEPIKHMTNATRLVLETGTEMGDDSCRRKIIRFLNETYQLKDITTPQEKDDVEKKRLIMKKSRSVIDQHHRDTLVLAGRVRSGQSVNAKKHLIIMGDVNPGCELTAGGDILVIGSLCGTAAAGQPNNRDAIILALDFQPIQIKIGEIVAAGLPAAGQGTPEYAHVENGGIVVDDYLEANPFKRIPWPVVR